MTAATEHDKFHNVGEKKKKKKKKIKKKRGILLSLGIKRHDN